jgi:hypothetical protein
MVISALASNKTLKVSKKPPYTLALIGVHPALFFLLLFYLNILKKKKKIEKKIEI